MSGGETIFHKIIRKEIPAKIVYEDDTVIAFNDIAPASPTHILFVPEKTIPTINDADLSDKALLGHMVLTAAQVARDLGLAEGGYRLVINCGPDGGQTVFQLHLHLLGGREHGWPPG